MIGLRCSVATLLVTPWGTVFGLRCSVATLLVPLSSYIFVCMLSICDATSRKDAPGSNFQKVRFLNSWNLFPSIFFK